MAGLKELIDMSSIEDQKTSTVPSNNDDICRAPAP